MTPEDWNTESCRQFCTYHGWGYPVDPMYLEHAEVMWDGTLGDIWWAAYIAGIASIIGDEDLTRFVAALKTTPLKAGQS